MNSKKIMMVDENGEFAGSVGYGERIEGQPLKPMTVEYTKKMKAISLWEPWASLIATGAKKIETRHWKTDYRGDLLICASKSLTHEGCTRTFFHSLLESEAFQLGLRPLNIYNRVTVDDLSFGKAVAVVRVVDCVSTNGLVVDRFEENFGNYDKDRYAWMLEDIRAIKKPFVPERIVKGQIVTGGGQGFFEVINVPERLEYR